VGKKILMIDDDPELGALVAAILNSDEFSVHHAHAGGDGIKKAYQIHPDLIILDVMMPDLDGFTVCMRLREMMDAPILMLTARSNKNDMMRGFAVGVDDFLNKPFDNHELEARVRALLRRSKKPHSGSGSHITSYADPVLKVDLLSKTVKLLGEVVELSPIEYNLLAYLVQEQGNVMPHRELVREVWGDTYGNSTAMLSLYIYYLRKKLKDGKHGHQYIRTFWGRGYWFAPRVDEEGS
jgi:DNA-binding response OmpR family regulator